MKTTLIDKATLALFAAQAALAAGVAFNCPTGPIPMHFDIAGQVDRYGDRTELAALLAGLAVFSLLVAGGLGVAAVRLDEQASARRRSLRVGQTLTLIAVAGVTGLIAVLALGAPDAQATPGIMTGAIGAIMAAVGAALGRVGPNPFVGVRTPWSYKSRLAWDRSNRLAGRLWFLGGLVALIAAPFAPQPMGLTVLIVWMVGTAVLAALESWRVWRADPDRQPF
ncbi:SdpI family protein [soil metagenome]